MKTGERAIEGLANMFMEESTLFRLACFARMKSQHLKGINALLEDAKEDADMLWVAAHMQPSPTDDFKEAIEEADKLIKAGTFEPLPALIGNCLPSAKCIQVAIGFIGRSFELENEINWESGELDDWHYCIRLRLEVCRILNWMRNELRNFPRIQYCMEALTEVDDAVFNRMDEEVEKGWTPKTTEELAEELIGILDKEMILADMREGRVSKDDWAFHFEEKAIPALPDFETWNNKKPKKLS